MKKLVAAALFGLAVGLAIGPSTAAAFNESGAVRALERIAKALERIESRCD